MNVGLAGGLNTSAYFAEYAQEKQAISRKAAKDAAQKGFSGEWRSYLAEPFGRPGVDSVKRPNLRIVCHPEQSEGSALASPIFAITKSRFSVAGFILSMAEGFLRMTLRAAKAI